MGIRIKGRPGGLFEIEIQAKSSYSDIKEDIRQKLSRSRGFFTGAGAKAMISGKEFSGSEKQDLRDMFDADYGIINVYFSDEAVPAEKAEIEAGPSPAGDESGDDRLKLVSKNYFNAMSIFVSHTLRSGQRVECEGDVVVLGDVNDGAEVIAGGSIAVMGAIRGLVHAGATGRNDVVVAANALRPKQLRISGKIAIFPEKRQADGPEIAEFKQGSIVIKTLRPGAKRI
jgi:septum site-determining protein MinC